MLTATKKMKLDLAEKIPIPEGVEIKVDGIAVSVKGEKGEVSKKLTGPNVNIEVKDSDVIFSSKKGTKREKRMIGTFKSHVKNMIQGVMKGHIYKLKICSSHFPMTVAAKDSVFEVQNFLGEKVPRKFKIRPGVDIKIEGQEITVESPDKELAGLTAAAIEQLCRITNRDRRIFQDGIYIIEKSEKEVE